MANREQPERLSSESYAKGEPDYLRRDIAICRLRRSAIEFQIVRGEVPVAQWGERS